MITFESTGSFKNTEKFLDSMLKGNLYQALEEYGRQGVAALSAATPKDSGLTASSWSYKVTKTKGSCAITWLNSNTVSGTPIAIMLQYGHGTGTGGYVQGRDYINPALRPVFDKIADNVWKAVTSS